MFSLPFSSEHSKGGSLTKVKPARKRRNVCTTTPPPDFSAAKSVDFKALPGSPNHEYVNDNLIMMSEPPTTYNSWEYRQEDVATMNMLLILQSDSVVSEVEFRYSSTRPRLPVFLRTANQVARCLTFFGGSDMIAGSTPQGSIFLLQREIKASKDSFKEVQNKLRMECGVDVWISQRLETFPDEAALELLLSEGIRARLLQTGRWMHAGDDAERLFDARLTNPLAPPAEGKQQRAHVNCPGFRLRVTKATVSAHKTSDKSKARKAGRRIDATLILEPFVVRALPLREQEEPARCVYCLPRLAAPATLVSVERVESTFPISKGVFQNAQDMKDFWNLQHGYVLPDEALAKVATVCFNGGLRLTYPAAVNHLVALRALAALGDLSLLRGVSLNLNACPKLAATLAASGEDGGAEATLDALSKTRESAGGSPRVLPPPILSHRVSSAAAERPTPKTPLRRSLSPSEDSPLAESPPEETPAALAKTYSLEARPPAACRECLPARALPPPRTYSPSRFAELEAFAEEVSPCFADLGTSNARLSFQQQPPLLAPSVATRLSPERPVLAEPNAAPLPQQQDSLLPQRQASPPRNSKRPVARRDKTDAAAKKRQRTQKRVTFEQPPPEADVADSKKSMAEAVTLPALSKGSTVPSSLPGDDVSDSLVDAAEAAFAADAEAEAEAEAEAAKASAAAAAAVQTPQAPKKPRARARKRV